jgi:SAM-dependent methyltransferase
VSYEESFAAEKKTYENCADVHKLSPIFHYWSSRYLLPKLQAFGFDSLDGLFTQYLRGGRFLSLGAGNCDLEIGLARGLQGDFIIDCVDLNPTMLERGRLAAETAGVASHLQFIEGDLNTWEAGCQYQAVIAHQSLHHVVNLEGLLDQVKKALAPGGRFLISDMIGRNGHQRWPEALDIVHEFWRKLPPSYRFNQIFGAYEELYQNWDCSVEGFEGVRSQDILPLLLERFYFCLFLPYGNVIDPFIDRAFGDHFDPAAEWDRSFIDQVQQRDEQELAAGHLTPTHMIAVLTNEPCPNPRFAGRFSPEFCVRPPGKNHISSLQQSALYDWKSWPHDTQKELEIACGHLAESGHEIKARTEWALNLQHQLDERTAWAMSLAKDVQEHTARVPGIEKELAERTAWALLMKKELERREGLELEIYKLLHHPTYFLGRALRGIRSRLRKFIM